jgi:hypothetical protein
MRFKNAKQDIQDILSWFSEAFSRPSFKLFSSFIISFIQLGKEGHSSSMVQSLTPLSKSLSSFTRFLGKNRWDVDELVNSSLKHFFSFFPIHTRSVVFLIMDDTIIRKSGKKIPGCAWHKDHAQNMANVFGHQWLLSALLYRDFLIPLGARLYHPKKTKGCGRFQTKITMAKRMLKALKLPITCKLYLLADSWYWAKELALLCRKQGYHMISQLKSNSVIWIKGKRTNISTLADTLLSYREVSLFLYGKNKTLKIAKCIGVIKDLGKVAVVIVKEKKKKPYYLVSTNIHLPAIDVVKYYAKRCKIEQMIKDLKQRLGFGDYQVRNLQAIHRHVALSLLSYSVLVFLKILQWLQDKKISLNISIRLLAFYVRKHIIIEQISVTLRCMKVRFKQNILEYYLEKIYA